MKFDVKILLLASIFAAIPAGLIGPIYAIFVNQIGGDILAASVSWSIFSLVLGVLILVFGLLEDDKLNKKAMVVIGYSIMAIGNLGYLFVSNVFQLFIVQAVLGIGGAVLTPAWDAIYSMQVDKKKGSSQWAYWEGGTRIVFSAATIVGGVVVTLYGFNALFILMFIADLLSALIAGLILKERNFTKKGE